MSGISWGVCHMAQLLSLLNFNHHRQNTDHAVNHIFTFSRQIDDLTRRCIARVDFHPKLIVPRREIRWQVQGAVIPDKYLVFFDFDKAEITTEAMRVMQETRDDANQAPFPRVLATGHADRAGSDAYNLRLSERRADAVQSALSGLGIGVESIEP